MKEVRDFSISASQYEIFRFFISRATTLYIRMTATAPVNLMLMDEEDRVAYENPTRSTHSYVATWGRKSDLSAAIDVSAGTWYLVVEGSTDPSRGRLEVFHGIGRPLAW